MSTNNSGKKALYAAQSSLPPLPVPTLGETLDTYLKSLEPLLTPAQLQASHQAAQAFTAPGSLGLKLQERLLQRAADAAKTPEKKSWLIDWWNDYAYMAYRDPLVIYVSYFFVFKDDKLRQNPAERAASLLRGAMLFRDSVVSETLEPDMAKKLPLCSEQYRFMFNSTRIPEIPSDTTRSADYASNTHVVVIRKNKFYSFDLVEKATGRILSLQEIQR